MLRRPSPSMVVAIVALIAALAGGAYAASKVGTKQIKKGAVTASKLAKGQRSQGFVFFDGSAKSLPAGTFTSVAELKLPAGGNYFVTAQTGLDPDPQVEETVECQITDDGATIARATTALAKDGTTFTGTLTLTGPVTGGNASLECNPSEPSSARHRMITAIRIGTLESQ